MKVSTAIVLGAALLAGGVAGGIVGAQFVPRYQLQIMAAGGAIRLNSRTGDIDFCRPYRVGPLPAEGETAITLSWSCTSTFRSQ